MPKKQGFISSLKSRLSRVRSKNGKDSYENESTDYAADYSSENSTSVTPNQTPKHCHHINRSVTSIIKQVSDNSYIQEQQRLRESLLRKHAFFELNINLRHGVNLVAMDKNGLSDPYVKFKQGDRLLCKSRTVNRSLNPVWDEMFVIYIEDPFTPINIKVFDYDWGLQDDFMGSAILYLTTIELEVPSDLTLQLEDPSRKNENLGQITLMVTLKPRSEEEKETHFLRVHPVADTFKRLKSQIWTSVVTILLIEGRNIIQNINGLPLLEPYVKFRLGNEKYKSKTSYRARWLEQFDFHLFDDEQLLEISLWNRNSTLGRTVLDLSSYPREYTQKMWKRFDDHPGELSFVFSIGGTTESATVSDLTLCKDNLFQQQICDRYKWYKTFETLKDIGHLTVKVYGATGLVSADIGGKSDPFCVLELENARLQTQTEYKTLTPTWNKIFTLNIKDITSVLVITVFDEDRDHKVEFLGKVAIPLLRIKNGVKHWYALKDKKMFNRAKGDKPQILLEMSVLWNPIRAIFRVLRPREELTGQEPKFKRQIFLYNVSRLKDVIVDILQIGRYINACLEWENPIRSIIALLLWITCCLWVGLEILPIAFLVMILKNWFVQWVTGTSYTHSNQYLEDTSDAEDEDNMEFEHKKTIKQKLQAVQEVSQTVQNTIGNISSIAERFKNIFNFTVPELTWFVAIFLLGAALLLRFVPLRVLLIFWGLWKFSKRAISPNSIPNNELMDILSRVPDNEHIVSKRKHVFIYIFISNMKHSLFRHSKRVILHLYNMQTLSKIQLNHLHKFPKVNINAH